MPSAAPNPPKSSSAAPPPMATLANRDNIKKRESEEEKRRKRRQQGETTPVNEPQESRWPQPKHWQGPDMPQSQRFSPSTLTLVDLANEIRRQEEEEKRRRLFGGPVEVDIPGVSAAPIGWEDDPGIVNLDEPDARERRSWRTADNPPGGVSLKMTPEITLGDRLRGAAMALPNYTARDVVAPVIDAAESFIANRPNPLETIATAGQPVVDYFLGPDASKQMGMETVAKGLRGTRDMVPRVGQILAEQAQKNIDESLALRGISDQTLPRNLNAAKTATAPPPPTSGTGGGLDIDLGGAFGMEEAEVEEPDVIDITMRPDLGRMAEMGAPQSPPAQQGDRPNLGQMAEMGRPVTVEDITPATPIEALGELARNANPTQDAGAVMQSAADIIQGGGLQMGSVDDYLAQRGQDPSTPVPANQAPIRLSPGQPSDAYSQIEQRYGKDAADNSVAFARQEGATVDDILQYTLESEQAGTPASVEGFREWRRASTAPAAEAQYAPPTMDLSRGVAYERMVNDGLIEPLPDPPQAQSAPLTTNLTKDQYYAAIAAAYGEQTANEAVKDPASYQSRNLIRGAVEAINRDPARRERYDRVLNHGVTSLNTYPGWQERQTTTVKFGDALGATAEERSADWEDFRNAFGVEAANQAAHYAQTARVPISRIKQAMDESVAAGGQPSMFDFGRVSGNPKPDGTPRERFDISDMPEMRKKDWPNTEPLYPGQKPSGRVRVVGEDDFTDIYFPDDVSRDLDAIREQGILNRAQVQELIRTQAPGASPDQVIVGTREQFAEQAERIAKNAQQNFSNTLRIAGLDEEGGIEALVARVSEGPKTADQRTWWQWLTGKDEPPPTAPAVGNIPEEPVPQRLRALNDINGLYARYGSLVGPQEMNQFIKDNYGRGVPDYFSEEFGPWAEKNRELADQIRSTMGHAAASGLFVPDKYIVFSN